MATTPVQIDELPETVYTKGSRGYTKPKHIHTSRDCHLLQQAGCIDAHSPDEIRDDWDRCTLCFERSCGGGVAKGDDPFKRTAALEAADPEDLGLSPMGGER